MARISRRKFISGAFAAAGAITLHDLLGATEYPPVKDDVQAPLQNSITPIIDIHRHCMWQPSNQIEKMMEKTLKGKIGWRDHPSGATITINGISAIVYPELMDIDIQVQKQEEAGVTMSILSFSMELEIMCQELSFPPEDMLTRTFNDKTAAMVARYPTKLSFMAMVNPFKKSDIPECERCISRYGAKGISIGTSWRGEFLDSKKLDPFWEYVQAKDVPIYLHPPFLPIGFQMMNSYRLEEVVGRPFDTTMTVARMIYSGVFDRYPKLKVVLPHMGGGLPNVIGRLDFGYRLGYAGLPDSEAAVCKNKPSDYLKTNLYVDIMGFSPAGIKQSLALFGTDRVLFGSDYAAVNISPKEHVDIVRNLGLSREDEAKIFWKNAHEIFRMT